MRKQYLLLLIATVASLQSFSNAAMPGMWETGHGSRFIPLFRADSIHFGKIQMKKELVMINLYPGFAAVKGEYWMYNTTAAPITLRVGYPVNGRYDHPLVDNVMFNDLYALQVKVNDQQVDVKRPAEGYDSVHRALDHLQMQNWYYWTCTFAPGQITKLTVYFLTNNSEAGLRKGYGVDEGNAFAYILETGRAWAGKIEEGQVLIRLNNGLDLKDIRGIYPGKIFYGDDKHLRYTFTNLEPDSSHNILLWYDQDKAKGLEFDKITASAPQYFAALDRFPLSEFNDASFRQVDKTDFRTHNSGLTWLWVMLTMVVVIGLAVIAGVIYLIYRLMRRSR